MKESIRVQRFVAILSVVLFLSKIGAFFLTHSVTVLTDAMESIVNVAAGFLGLFSISLAAKPRDTNHPYGHGKAEFLSSAVEGTLITIAGIVIIYEAVEHLIAPHELQQLNVGLMIIVVSGAVNYLAGKYARNRGERHNSMVLVSAGNHLMTDAYSTVAIVVGLVALLLTHNKFLWLDSVVAMIFSVIIIRTGYKVIRRSISGIMDEMDVNLMKKVVAVLEEHRQRHWIDLHNLRVIDYGSILHVDAHMTLPWYYQVVQADEEIHKVEGLIKDHFSTQEIEVFIHIDGCLPFQCKLCQIMECTERKEAFKGLLKWDEQNVWMDARHGKTVA